jgi:glutathione peroxidase
MTAPNPPMAADALDVPIARLDGAPSTLREIVGPNAALVVNVASQCGLTPQYRALERLQKKYADAGLTVVGVPCNQFGGQEPGTSEEIATFCSTTYGVTFALTEKIEVNGPGRHPLYQRLVATPDERGRAGDIGWNFEKFLVDRSGRVVARFSPPTTPDDPRVVGAVEAVLQPG